MITVLSPRPPRAKTSLRLASRPRDLNGKTIGLLDNGKRNFDVYLDRTEELLRQKYDFVSIRRRKPSPLKAIPRELFDDMVERCDAIITGSGD